MSDIIKEAKELYCAVERLLSVIDVLQMRGTIIDISIVEHIDSARATLEGAREIWDEQTSN